MAALNKRAKICLVLFAISLGIAILSSVGAVFVAYSKSYAAAVVLAAVALIGFYSAPIYYNNSALSSASAKIISALDGGNLTIEELAEKTGIRADVCKKLFEKAFKKGYIIDFVLEDGKIVKK